MKKTLTALTLAIGAIGASQAAPVQWTVGSGGNGHWYEFISTSVDWNTARANALASTFLGMQGYLATITSLAENVFVTNHSWLGFTRTEAQVLPSGSIEIGMSPSFANALRTFN